MCTLYADQLDEPCLNESSTSIVSYARDVLAQEVQPDVSADLVSAPSLEVLKTWSEDEQHVCIKRMRHRSQFETEICLRLRIPAKNDAVIQILGWHMPRDEQYELPTSSSTVSQNCVAGGQRKQSTAAADEYPYVLVLQRAARSLHEACAKERLARYDWRRVVSCMRDVAQCIQQLHDAGLVHGDIKQRNILRLDKHAFSKKNSQDDAHDQNDGSDGRHDQLRVLDEKWTLCDLDCASILLHDPCFVFAAWIDWFHFQNRNAEVSLRQFGGRNRHYRNRATN